MGEKQPYESFELTHGICDPCWADGRHKDSSHIRALQPIAAFYQDLRDKAVAGVDISIPEVIADSKKLGITSVDMTIGILQPILNEMGRLFLAGKVTVAKEHAFTQKVESLISDLFTMTPAMKNCQGQKPLVILSCVDGNYHWLGLRLLELSLLEEGIPVRAFIPSLPQGEVIQLAVDMRPLVLGLSVYDLQQCHEAWLIREGIQRKTAGTYVPHMAVGGHGAKEFLEQRGVDQLIDQDIGYFRQGLDFVAYMKTFLMTKDPSIDEASA
jgi:methanogenic corrinoid protein MtbC1